MGLLNNLGIKHHTDKSSPWHNYLDLYENHLAPLKNKPITFWEIGVHTGNSIRMWDEYFVHSDTKLYGLDNVDRVELRPARFNLFVGLQEDRANLRKIVEQVGLFDVIVDDGGHTMQQQQISMGFLFPWVKPGGLYIIEDLHTSYNKRKMPRFNATGTKKTTLRMLQGLRDTGKINSDFITAKEAAYIEENVQKCSVEKGREEICFIYKNSVK